MANSGIEPLYDESEYFDATGRRLVLRASSRSEISFAADPVAPLADNELRAALQRSARQLSARFPELTELAAGAANASDLSGVISAMKRVEQAIKGMKRPRRWLGT